MGIDQVSDFQVLTPNGVRCFGVYERFGKRAFDLVLCVVILPIAVPIIAICWLLSRLDGGAGFFIQDRVGRGGATFASWKICTMIPGAETALDHLLATDEGAAKEWKTAQKLTNDPRITRFGRAMRATGLDELPQIWNVLRGEMSLIGPRPFTRCQQPIYQQVSSEPAYYRLRPGISGLWQVSCRNSGTFSERVHWDETYAQDVNFVTDLRITLRTVVVVCRATGR